MTGSEIRRRRIRLGLSRDQLAHQLGVSADTIEAWEGGASSISCPHALMQILRNEECADDTPRRRGSHTGLRT